MLRTFIRSILNETTDEALARVLDFVHSQKPNEKYVGLDDKTWPTRPMYVFQTTDSRGSYLIAYTPSLTPGKEWDKYNYTGSVFSMPNPRSESADRGVRESFTSAWDAFFYEVIDDSTPESQIESLLRDHMSSAGWQCIGTIGEVGIVGLQKDDALTSLDNNEFYQFVLSKKSVEKLGGRGKVPLIPENISPDLQVWRKG